MAVRGFGMNRSLVITPASGQIGVTTITVTVTDAGGKTASSSFALTVIPPTQVAANIRGDFNHDGLFDLVFQDRDGFLAVWHMNGGSLGSAELLEPRNVGDVNYRVVASADFDQDGREDLLFQHKDGALAIWLMDGARLNRTLLPEPDRTDNAAWKVAATGDLNDDGKPDLVLQHTDGTIEVWIMDGVRRTQRTPTTPNTPGDRNWRVVATGDFNGDQQVDLVFQHTDGNLAVWILNGTTLTAGVLLNPPRFGDLNAKVVSAVDQN